MREWYTYVSWGSDPTPAKGPFKTIQQADAALDNFKGRHGHRAGTWLTSGNVQLVGPYPTRKAAQDADISDDNKPRPNRDAE